MEQTQRPPPDHWLAAIVKFGQKAHLENLYLRGELYMRTARWFRQAESRTGRGDRHEGATQLLQGGTLTITIEQTGEQIVIPPEAMVGPLVMSSDESLDTHIFCATGLTLGRIRAAARRSEPMVDPRCFNLGQWALVVTRPDRFMQRLRVAAAQRSLSMRTGLVNYVDFTQLDGEVDIFTKAAEFRYQDEWRVAVPPSGRESFTLELGPLEDIGKLVPAAEINEGWHVEPT